jgi:Family of unknown function (DUF5908)
MPVEIKELVITAIMPSSLPNDLESEDESEGSSGTANQPKEELVQACVQQVMKILERKGKR